MRKAILYLFGALILLAPACGTIDEQALSYSYQQPPELNDGWQTAPLFDRNIDTELIEEMVSQVRDGVYKNIHGILLVRGSRLVLEEYFPGWTFNNQQSLNYTRDTLHFIASCTKSVTSALVGIARDRGYIGSLDTRVRDFFPQFADIDWSNGRDRITLRHLLTMTAGLDWDEWAYDYFDPRNIHSQMLAHWHPMLFIITIPMAHEPGTVWAYNSGLSILLGGIIKNTTGWFADDFAERFLFAPLGIEEYQWQTLGTHYTIQTGGGLILKPRDMAKFGQLYLNRGVWQGRRVISEEWVEESVRKHVERSDGWYGYQWWLERHPWKGGLVESYSARGLGGQFIFVFTELDLVVVLTGGNQYTGADPGQTLVHQYILPAVN
jgi:CubicO group peptidase (beta-lactamase class C family)